MYSLVPLKWAATAAWCCCSRLIQAGDEVRAFVLLPPVPSSRKLTPLPTPTPMWWWCCRCCCCCCSPAATAAAAAAAVAIACCWCLLLLLLQLLTTGVIMLLLLLLWPQLIEDACECADDGRVGTRVPPSSDAAVADAVAAGAGVATSGGVVRCIATACSGDELWVALWLLLVLRQSAVIIAVGLSAPCPSMSKSYNE